MATYIVEKVTNEYNINIGTTDNPYSVRNIIENHFKKSIDQFKKLNNPKGHNVIRVYMVNPYTYIIIKKISDLYNGHSSV